MTLEAQLEMLEVQTGRPQPLLQQAQDFPIEARYLWEAFWDLSSSERKNYGFGPLRISSSDLEAWQRMTGVELGPGEIAIFKAMDSAFMKAVSDYQAEQMRRNRRS